MVIVELCRCLDSNCRPLVYETTALPTELQPLPRQDIFAISPTMTQTFPRSTTFCCCEEASKELLHFFRRRRKKWKKRKKLFQKAFCQSLFVSRCSWCDDVVVGKLKKLGATIAQWIRLCLPSCRPNFESPAHQSWVVKFVLYMMREKNKKKTKRGRVLSIFNKKLYANHFLLAAADAMMSLLLLLENWKMEL